MLTVCLWGVGGGGEGGSSVRSEDRGEGEDENEIENENEVNNECEGEWEWEWELEGEEGGEWERGGKVKWEVLQHEQSETDFNIDWIEKTYKGREGGKHHGWNRNKGGSAEITDNKKKAEKSSAKEFRYVRAI